MVYLFTGDDIEKKISSYENFIAGLSPQMETFFINKNDFDPEQIESFSLGANLFFDQCAVIFLNVLEKEENLVFVLEKLNNLISSRNNFVFFESFLESKVLASFEKAKAQVHFFDLPKVKKEKFDNFLLANAFGQKDKFRLWLYFRQAVDIGVSLEELAGVLFWKSKDLLLKKNFQKFSEKELQDFNNRISILLPEVRKLGWDDEISFEKFLLEAF